MQYPRFLWFLALSYSMLTILINWFSPYSIDIFKFKVNAAILAVPLSFISLSIITEVYGYKLARRVFWYGFLFNTLLLIYEYLIIYLPSPEYAIHNKLLDTLLVKNLKIILALTISYLVSQPLNLIIIAKSKITFKGQYVISRFMACSFLATIIGSFLFSLILFNKITPSLNLQFIVILLVVTFLTSALSAHLSKKLKKTEKLDIYDRETNFNLFNFNISYFVNENEFEKTSEKDPYFSAPIV